MRAVENMQKVKERELQDLLRPYSLLPNDLLPNSADSDLISNLIQFIQSIQSIPFFLAKHRSLDPVDTTLPETLQSGDLAMFSKNTEQYGAALQIHINRAEFLQQNPQENSSEILSVCSAADLAIISEWLRTLREILENILRDQAILEAVKHCQQKIAFMMAWHIQHALNQAGYSAYPVDFLAQKTGSEKLPQNNLQAKLRSNEAGTTQSIKEKYIDTLNRIREKNNLTDNHWEYKTTLTLFKEHIAAHGFANKEIYKAALSTLPTPILSPIINLDFIPIQKEKFSFFKFSTWNWGPFTNWKNKCVDLFNAISGELFLLNIEIEMFKKISEAIHSKPLAELGKSSLPNDFNLSLESINIKIKFIDKKLEKARPRFGFGSDRKKLLAIISDTKSNISKIQQTYILPITQKTKTTVSNKIKEDFETNKNKRFYASALSYSEHQMIFKKLKLNNKIPALEYFLSDIMSTSAKYIIRVIPASHLYNQLSEDFFKLAEFCCSYANPDEKDKIELLVKIISGNSAGNTTEISKNIPEEITKIYLEPLMLDTSILTREKIAGVKNYFLNSISNPLAAPITNHDALFQWLLVRDLDRTHSKKILNELNNVALKWDGKTAYPQMTKLSAMQQYFCAQKDQVSCDLKKSIDKLMIDIAVKRLACLDYQNYENMNELLALLPTFLLSNDTDIRLAYIKKIFDCPFGYFDTFFIEEKVMRNVIESARTDNLSDKLQEDLSSKLISCISDILIKKTAQAYSFKAANIDSIAMEFEKKLSCFKDGDAIMNRWQENLHLGLEQYIQARLMPYNNTSLTMSPEGLRVIETLTAKLCRDSKTKNIAFPLLSGMIDQSIEKGNLSEVKLLYITYCCFAKNNHSLKEKLCDTRKKIITALINKIDGSDLERLKYILYFYIHPDLFSKSEATLSDLMGDEREIFSTATLQEKLRLDDISITLLQDMLLTSFKCTEHFDEALSKAFWLLFHKFSLAFPRAFSDIEDTAKETRLREELNRLLTARKERHTEKPTQAAVDDDSFLSSSGSRTPPTAPQTPPLSALASPLSSLFLTPRKDTFWAANNSPVKITTGMSA